MNIVLVCASGMSTSILMDKMEKYWAKQHVPLVISAVGLGEYQDACADCDIIMAGPQIAYRVHEIHATTGKPCAAIPSFDYAVANCESIMKLAKKLYREASE